MRKCPRIVDVPQQSQDSHSEGMPRVRVRFLYLLEEQELCRFIKTSWHVGTGISIYHGTHLRPNRDLHRHPSLDYVLVPLVLLW